MKCTKCGAELEDGVKTCPYCDEPVVEQAAPEETVTEDAAPEATVQPAETENNKTAEAGGFLAKLKGLDAKFGEKLGDKKNYVYAGVIGVIGLIILISIIAAIIPNGNGYLYRDEHNTLIVNDDTVYVISEGKIKKVKTSAESVGAEKASSIDGKITVFESKGVLYRLKGKKAVQIAEDVEDFHLSLYGDYVIYTVREEGAKTYYHCKVSNGKSVKLFESDLESILLSFVMSPDGKSVAYLASDGLDTPELYYFTGKKATKVAECSGKVVGLTDDGKYIYATDTNDSGKCYLYSYKKNGKETKIDSCDSTCTFFFNLDATEIMYVSNGKTYISRKAGDPVKAANSELNLITPAGTASAYRTPSLTRVYPVDSLFGHVYGNGTNAYFVDKKESKCVKLVKGSNFVLDESAEYLYYMDKKDLKVLKISKGEKAEDKAKLIAEDVYFYLVTSDRKLVYYADEDLDLYAVNGNKGGKAKKISSDALQDAPVLDRNDVVYYACDDAVYAAKGKRAGKKIMEDAECEKVGGYVYIFDEDETIYAAKGKGKPKKLISLEY